MKKILCIYFIIFSSLFGEPQKLIIVDLNNVLFTINTFKFIRKIGFGGLSSYVIKHWKNPINVCLDILDRMCKEPGQKPTIDFNFLGKPMPQCIVELYLGKREGEEVLVEVLNYLKVLDKRNYFADRQEKHLMESIAKALIKKEIIAAVIQPMQNIAQLVTELKLKNYTVCALSNLTKEGFEVYCHHLPSLPGLFDEMFLSYQINNIKPQIEIYQQVLTKFNIKPEQCIAIESCSDYCAVAQKLGIKTVLHTNIKKTKQQLKKLGVIV